MKNNQKIKKVLLLSLLPVAGSIPLLASNCSNKLSDNEIAQIFAESSQVKEGFPETWYNAYSTSVAYKKINENMNNASFISFIKQVNSNARAKIINVYAKINESQKSLTKESWIDVYYDLQYKDIVASSFLKKNKIIDNHKYAYHFKTKVFLKDEEANVTKFNELYKDVFANVELTKEVLSLYDPQKFVDELAKLFDKNGKKIVEKTGDYCVVKLIDLYKKTLNKNNLVNIYLEDGAKKIIEPKKAGETNNDYEILASRTHIKWKKSGNDSVSFQFYIDAGDKQISWNPLTLSGFKTESNQIHDGSESIQNGINYLELFDTDFTINKNAAEGQIPSIFNETLQKDMLQKETHAIYEKSDIENLKKSGSSSYKIEKTISNGVNVSLKKEKETSVDLSYVENESARIAVKLLNSWPDDNAPTITIDYALILYKEVEANGKKEYIEIARVPKTKQILDPNGKLITKAQRLNDLVTIIKEKLESNKDYEFNNKFINFVLNDKEINTHDSKRWFNNNNNIQQSNTLASLFMLRQAISNGVNINGINENSLAEANINKNFNWFSSNMNNWTEETKVIDTIKEHNFITNDDKELLNELLVGYKLINIEPADSEGKIYANVNLTFITNSSINVNFKTPIDLIKFKKDNSEKNNYFDLNTNQSIAFNQEIEFDYNEDTSIKLDGNSVPFYKLWTNDGIDGIDKDNKEKIQKLIELWESKNKIEWVKENLNGFSNLNNVDLNNSIYEKIKYANTDISLNSTDNNDWLLLRKLGRVKFDITEFSKSSNNSLDLSINLKYNNQVIKRGSNDQSVKFVFKTMSNKTKMIREIANKVNNEVKGIGDIINKSLKDLYDQEFFYDNFYEAYEGNIKNIQNDIEEIINLDKLSDTKQIENLFFDPENKKGGSLVNRLNKIIMSFLKPDNANYPGDNIYAKYINGIINSFKNQNILANPIKWNKDGSQNISFIKLFENNLNKYWKNIDDFKFEKSTINSSMETLWLNTKDSKKWDAIVKDNASFANDLHDILTNQITIETVTDKLQKFLDTYKSDAINDYMYLYKLAHFYNQNVKTIAQGIDNNEYKELYKGLTGSNDPISNSSALFNIFDSSLWTNLFPDKNNTNQNNIRNSASLRQLNIGSFLSNANDKNNDAFFDSFKAKLNELLKMLAFLLYTKNFKEVLTDHEIKKSWENACKIFKGLVSLTPNNYKINALTYYEYFTKLSDENKNALSYQIDNFNIEFKKMLAQNTDNNIFETLKWTTNNQPDLNNILDFYKNIVLKYNKTTISDYKMFNIFRNDNNTINEKFDLLNTSLPIPTNIYSNATKMNNIVEELKKVISKFQNLNKSMESYLNNYFTVNKEPFNINNADRVKIKEKLDLYKKEIAKVKNWHDLLHSDILSNGSKNYYTNAVNNIDSFNDEIYNFYYNRSYDDHGFSYNIDINAKNNNYIYPIFQFKQFKELLKSHYGATQEESTSSFDLNLSVRNDSIFLMHKGNKILDFLNIKNNEYNKLKNSDIELVLTTHHKWYLISRQWEITKIKIVLKITDRISKQASEITVNMSPSFVNQL